VEAVLVEVGGHHLDPNDLAVEAFGLVLGQHVAHHDGHALHVELGVTQPAEEARPAFGDQGQQLGVVEVTGLVDVADVDLHLRGEDEVIRQFKLDTGHGCTRSGEGKKNQTPSASPMPNSTSKPSTAKMAAAIVCTSFMG